MDQRWIPASERLPEEGEDVLLWVEYLSRGDYDWHSTYGIGYQFEGYFHIDGIGKKHVFAWQPLPEPYKGENNHNI